MLAVSLGALPHTRVTAQIKVALDVWCMLCMFVIPLMSLWTGQSLLMHTHLVKVDRMVCSVR